METITFTCQVITPMFLAGADGQTPELRAPSIKGAMLFWWRALNGHLVNPTKGQWDYKDIREKETDFFGGTQNGGRSKFSLQIRQPVDRFSVKKKLVPHDSNKGMKGAFEPHKQAFELIIRCQSKDKEKLQALFTLTSVLGSVGKRSRRGMGAFSIEKVMDENSEVNNMYPDDIEALLRLINMIGDVDSFKKQGANKIVNRLETRPDFPFIREIQWGKPDSNILLKISQTTHELKKANPESYEPSLGHASRGRFASPMYASVVKGNIPVVTTLNTVPNRDKYKIDTNLQNEFKSRIL